MIARLSVEINQVVELVGIDGDPPVLDVAPLASRLNRLAIQGNADALGVLRPPRPQNEKHLRRVEPIGELRVSPGDSILLVHHPIPAEGE